MKWYALFVETGRETLIQKWIQYFFDPSVCYSIVPRRRLTEKRQGKKHQVIRTMFPGYVFINTDMCVEVYYKLAEIPKIIRVLNNGSYWSNINDEEMAAIISLVDDKGIIDYSEVFIENSRVFVKDGPLKTMEGIIRRVDKRKSRATIILNFMGEPRMIDLGIDILDSHNTCLTEEEKFHVHLGSQG